MLESATHYEFLQAIFITLVREDKWISRNFLTLADITHPTNEENLIRVTYHKKPEFELVKFDTKNHLHGLHPSCLSQPQYTMTENQESHLKRSPLHRIPSMNALKRYQSMTYLQSH